MSYVNINSALFFLKLYNSLLFPALSLWQHTDSCVKGGVADDNSGALEGLEHKGTKRGRIAKELQQLFK